MNNEIDLFTSRIAGHPVMIPLMVTAQTRGF